MGINDEYSRDAFNYTLAYDSDDSDEGPEPLSQEDWQDWHSEDLIEAWSIIKDYNERNYIRTTSTYPKFVQFVMDSHETHDLFVVPTETEESIWKLISGMRIIQDNVQDAKFYLWIRKNINRNCNV